MATTNPVTGDLIKSKTGDSNKYSEGWDRIFGNKEEPKKEEKKDDKSL